MSQLSRVIDHASGAASLATTGTTVRVSPFGSLRAVERMLAAVETSGGLDALQATANRIADDDGNFYFALDRSPLDGDDVLEP